MYRHGKRSFRQTGPQGADRVGAPGASGRIRTDLQMRMRESWGVTLCATRVRGAFRLKTRDHEMRLYRMAAPIEQFIRMGVIDMAAEITGPEGPF